MIDTHCHLTMLPDDVLPGALERAWEAGLRAILIPAGSPDDLEHIPTLLRMDPRLFGMLGYHPEHAGSVSTQEVRALESALANERIVGIGEAGIDFYWKDDASTRAEQLALCRAQIVLAARLDLPICLHLRDKDGRRDAAEALLALLRDTPGVRAILHSSTLDRDSLAPFAELGCWVSYSGILTFPKADAVRLAAATVPEHRLLVETDAPLLAPVPHRGKSNEPAFVRATSDMLAQVRGIDSDACWRLVDANACALFGLPIPA